MLRVLTNPVGVTSMSGIKPSATIVAWPNPAHDKTEIDFDSEQPGWVRLDVFDLQGRMVKQLVHKYMGQGPQKFTWDLSNQMGRKVGAGIYLARLVRANQTLQIRMVVR